MRSASSASRASRLSPSARFRLSFIAASASGGPFASRRASASASLSSARIRHHAVREAERQALRGREPLAEEQDLARARRADEARQEPARAVVAREPELHVGRRHEGALGHHAQVAGEREREAGAGGRARQRGQRRLRACGAARAGCRAPSAAAACAPRARAARLRAPCAWCRRPRRTRRRRP